MEIVTDEKPSSGSGTMRVYTVEARLSHNQAPTEENGMLLDGQWRRVYFKQNALPIGVPHGLFNADAAQHGYVSHDSAMALAWWFLAQCSLLSVETRIVEYEYAHSYTCTRRVDGDPIQRGVWSLMREIEKAANGHGVGAEQETVSPSVAHSAPK